jgi:hypothetical protein
VWCFDIFVFQPYVHLSFIPGHESLGTKRTFDLKEFDGVRDEIVHIIQVTVVVVRMRNENVID